MEKEWRLVWHVPLSCFVPLLLSRERSECSPVLRTMNNTVLIRCVTEAQGAE